MGSKNQTGLAVEFVERPMTSALEVDLVTGPASAFAGLRRVLRTLREAGAGFGPLPERYPAEWAVLTGERGAMERVSAIALSASERRLHRESEQSFRVLALGARALCEGSRELAAPLVLRGLGRTDLPTLHGLVRAAEYAAATGHGGFTATLPDALEVEPITVMAVDFREERARCLRLLGLDVDVTGLRHAARPVTAGRGDTAAYTVALDPDASARDRVAAALAYSRSAFYTANWEGMAMVAGACLPAAAELSAGDVAWLGAGHGTAAYGEDNHAIEFEPALLRHRDDLRGFLLKVLGIQAAFRGRHDDAIFYFRAIRECDGPISPELRAQSHLYAALTLTKRQHRLADAVAELEGGFAAVPARKGEPVSERRERGWLHNLRGLTLFAERRMVAAFEQEKSALECIEGLSDASSVHLRVNLVSNISVLQENAGKLEQAQATWERFRDTAFEQDAKFVKHHAYRAGGLRLKAGDRASCAADLGESLRQSVLMADDFHECEIALELGALQLDRGDAATAAEHFDLAAAAAARLGDPYRIALAEIARSAALGRRPGEDVLRAAGGSLALSEKARALVDACHAGADPGSVLPRPRTKLNRPFDLVTF